jgi:ATP-dependent helicase HrpB
LAPQDLPIYDIADDLVSALSTTSRLVLTAPTGSGKSTQVPQILLDRGLLGCGSVVVLQPRRLAARLLASRVAEERGSPLGAEVGYQVRFERQACDATRILYVTEGILLRRLLSSPNLDGISTILFDEFHERHVYGDLTLARARLL